MKAGRIWSSALLLVVVIAVIFGVLYEVSLHRQSTWRQEAWNGFAAEMNMASYDISKYGTSHATVPVATAADDLHLLVWQKSPYQDVPTANALEYAAHIFETPNSFSSQQLSNAKKYVLGVNSLVQAHVNAAGKLTVTSETDFLDELSKLIDSQMQMGSHGFSAN